MTTEHRVWNSMPTECTCILSQSFLTNQLITFGLPWRWLSSGSIEFIKQQTECFLAGERVAGEERTITNCKLNFNVQPICWATIDERRPKPIVHIIVGHIAHDIATPIDTLAKVCEWFFNPLAKWNMKYKAIRKSNEKCELLRFESKRASECEWVSVSIKVKLLTQMKCVSG